MSYNTIIKKAVEANWTKETSPAQVSIRQVGDVLGLDVLCDPDWTTIVSKLNNFFVDKSELVTTVTQFITIWTQNVVAVATDSSHRSWVNTCKKKVPGNELVLQVQVGQGAQPYTRWEDDHFVLLLPKMKPHPPKGYSVQMKQGIISVFD